ncbi:Sdh6p Ecym_4637 [Eremothecium cymbalariae DBVPG|uniref:Complex 1 LYR protein domain-containing protein n=1 Tax=Eremothecium cymbalariae (strain CBS 270.75 / DBVPG 7215 / KCTC 17166 / NRRL Y-17582) TaxID=931890 RepID=G8JSD8_ERECY|nr:hypothetical protein Ecym_4637 [Eremothecium cymbalariae DBVPG\
MVRRLSGLQREVLHLYRRSIRVAYNKSSDSRPHFVSFIRKEFAKYRDVPKKDFNTIEYLIRIGHKKVDTYSSPELKDIH